MDVDQDSVTTPLDPHGGGLVHWVACRLEDRFALGLHLRRPRLVAFDCARSDRQRPLAPARSGMDVARF